MVLVLPSGIFALEELEQALTADLVTGGFDKKCAAPAGAHE
jgi:hypothetical protein